MHCWLGLPELGQISRGEAPPWSAQGGCAEVRRILYMATLTARTYNPMIKDTQRVTAAGRPVKVAMVACMRKLLTILNAMLKNKKPWQAPLTN